MIVRATLLILSLLSVQQVARAQESASCLPAFNSLQALTTIDPKAGFRQSFELISENSQSRFATKVLLTAWVPTGEATLKMKLGFDPGFAGVSLPYNLFAVAVLVDGRVLAWYDYTNSCQSAPLGFFAGREIPLPDTKLVGLSAQRLQIMVWGKL